MTGLPETDHWGDPTSTVLGTRARVLIQEESYDEAESLFREALPASRRVLGPDHPDTLVLQAEFAALLRQIGRPEEAAVVEGGKTPPGLPV